MAAKKKYSALGRGLDALISTDEVKPQGSSTINEIPLDQIEANPNQPRRDFDPETLQDLANSIRVLGIVQPITLRQIGDDRYQIVAGERRWRASIEAGLTTIPAYIRTIDDESVMEMALVENIQREDLNAIEIALAYAHLLQQEGMTQEKVAERVGKSRVAVANARALLSLDSPSQQQKVFKEIQRTGASVRQVEELVKKLKNGEKGSLSKSGSSASKLPEEFNILREQMSGFFQTKVSLSMSPDGKGKISIPFDNEEELERIMSLFDNLKRP